MTPERVLTEVEVRATAGKQVTVVVMVPAEIPYKTSIEWAIDALQAKYKEYGGSPK